MYIIISMQRMSTLHILKKKTIVNGIVNENEREKCAWRCDSRRRDKYVQISPVQFLRDQEIQSASPESGQIEQFL